jgi:tetratricopeptide (TPR) repeat protein
MSFKRQTIKYQPLVVFLLLVCHSPVLAAEPRLLLRQGRQLLAEQNYAEANQCLIKYVSNYPGDPNGYFWLGKVADDKGDPKTAMGYYAKSLVLAKKNGMDSEALRVNLGNAVLKLNYLDAAIFDYQRAIEINDKSMLAHFNLSKTYLLKGLYEKSLQELSLCSQLGLVDNTLTLWRALALKGLGRTYEAQNEAKEYYEAASGQDMTELRNIASQLTKP